MNKNQRKLKNIFDILVKEYGNQECTLNYLSPFQLLTAVILSAQCTDKQVNKVTPILFEKCPDPESMYEIPLTELENIIKSTGFFKNKSRNLKKCSEKILSDFNGKVPKTMNELVTLAGVGRKTANVVLGNAFNVPGFPVDTHVKRLLKRIGVVNEENPDKIEAVVNKNIAPESWTNFSHILILHGRKICSARKPKCEKCSLKKICRFYLHIPFQI